jgi:hypothetical protein
MNEPTPIHDRLCSELGVRQEMRRTLYDDIAAAAMPGLLALLDADLTIARSHWDNA